MSATSTRPSPAERIRAAHWFADRGFGVFSAWSTTPDGVCKCSRKRECPSPGKHPIGEQGFLENTRDHDKITLLLSAGSEPNYGLVCPDGVFVLDVDGDGVAQLADLERLHGPLPPTLRTNTAHGQHVFLRWPADLPRPMKRMFGYVTRWGSGSAAGYVIGPRSVHASGAVYAPAGPFTEIAEIPRAWAEAAVEPARADGPLVIEVGSGGYQLPDEGYTESRYDAIRDYIASRYMRGHSREEVWAGVLIVLAPRFAQPLADADLRTRFDRAWRGTAERLGPPQPPQQVPESVSTAPAEQVVAAAWPTAPDPAVYHGPLGDIALAVADHTEADPVGILATLLSSAGACMGHGRYIYQGSAQGPNIFAVLVGDSSTGRKGTAGSIAREVMDAAWPAWQDIVVAGLGSGEGLIGYLREKEKEGEHRALVMESEFGRLLTVMAREGSTLSPVVRDAWDGVTMGRVLAREQAIVRYHHVGVVAHITPVELRQKLTGTDAANGFGNRFLWFCVRRTRLVPFPESPMRSVDPDSLAAVSRAIELSQGPGEVRWSQTGRDAWEDLYGELAAAGGRSGLLGAMTARAEAQIVRLALLYALLDCSPVIEPVHLNAGRRLWDYAERSVTHVMGDSTGDRGADVLRSLLADGPVTWTQARQECGFRTGGDLKAAVDLLQAIGFAEVVKERMHANDKRPTRFIRAASRSNNRE